jgi:glycosyltransferase involved in cell wall biosynthesis
MAIEFPGQVAYQDVGLLMRRATCLWAARESEAMPNVVIKALACGLPVVATDVGKVSRVAKHRKTGWVCAAPGEYPANKLLAGLRFSVAQDWDVAQLSQNIRQRTWHQAALDVGAVLSSVVDG